MSISIPNTMSPEFTEASEELVPELCSPGRRDKCLEEDIWKGQGAAMRENRRRRHKIRCLEKKAASGE